MIESFANLAHMEVIIVLNKYAACAPSSRLGARNMPLVWYWHTIYGELPEGGFYPPLPNPV
jgi:hypothetical protein